MRVSQDEGSLHASEGKGDALCSPPQLARGYKSQSIFWATGRPSGLCRSVWAHTVRWLRVALLGPAGSWARC